MNETLRGHMEKLADCLGQALCLLDYQGRSLWPSSPASYYLPETLRPLEPQSLNGYSFLRLEGEEGYVLLIRDSASSHDLLRLAALSLGALMSLQPGEEDRQSAARRLLTEALDQSEVDALLDKQAIPRQMPRCVMLLSLAPHKGLSAYQQLLELLPLGEEDILTPIDQGCAALIKALDRGLGAGEPEEFAQALQDTIQEETGLALTCGIGETVSSAEALPQSYAQAKEALAIGQQYPLPGRLYVYRRLWLSRFLSHVAPDTARHFYGLLFNKRTASLFTPEMLKTIEMFLEKDLNLSDTARQLYIHRNTLVYRLDKVQRLSGLDLRRFDDAFVFQLFYMLKPLFTSPIPRPDSR